MGSIVQIVCLDDRFLYLIPHVPSSIIVPASITLNFTASSGLCCRCHTCAGV